MRQYKNFITKAASSIAAILVALSSQAQEISDVTKNAPLSNTYAQVFIVLVALVLAFVIWGMSRILLEYARKVVEKNRKTGKILPLILMMALSFYSYSSLAQDSTIATPKVSFNYYGLSTTAFWFVVSVIAFELVVIFFLKIHIRKFEKELFTQKVKVKSFSFNSWWARRGSKLFTRAVPLEREKDILLDHDYDGIRELDNSLPPWWKYGFYATIGFAIIYLLNYQVLGYGKNPTQEYNEEMAKAKIQMAAYAAKSGNTVDETNIKMPDASGLARGKEIFTTTCWPCHGKLGEGGVGPNLTDNYWLHKGSLNDIYQSVKHGYPDKGMQAWGNSFSAKEINDLAGFIETLKGTNPPNAKAPQGDLYTGDASEAAK